MADTKTAKAAKVNQYEAMFLVGPMAATEPQAAIDLCRGVIERHGGQILVIKRWDERRLAYEIEGQKRGTYVLAYYKGPGSSVGGIERDVNLSEDLLRVMILRADHLNQEEMEKMEPQPIVREERPERPSWETGDRGDRGGDRFSRGPRGPRREEAPADEDGANKDA